MKVFFNGTILTMDDTCRYADILIEDKGSIIFVGNEINAQVFLSEQQTQPEWIDLKGYTLMPAFIDAHSHLSDMAQTLKTADLRHATCFNDIERILKDYVLKHPEHHDLIIGLSYDHNFLAEKSHPTKACLDKVSRDIPIAIVHSNLHMCCVNSRLLEMLHITADTPDIEGGVIGRIGDTNEPSGYLEEAASFPIRHLLKEHYPLTQEDLLAAQQLYIENGILTIQDGAVGEALVDTYAKISKNNQLRVDVVAYPCFNFGDGVGNAITNYPQFINTYKNRFKIGGYKLLLDGSPQGKSAWLSEPYQNEETYCGYPWLSDEEVQAYIKQAFNDNLQLLTHCNGDAASEQLINAYAEVLQHTKAQSDYPLRPVMVHCQTVRKDQLRRMKPLNMIASIFVDHVYYWGDIHRKNLGEARAKRISPVHSALKEGLIYTFHTDSPVVLPNTLHSVWSACNRLTKSGVTLGEDECVDVYQALKAVTIHAAYGYFEEKEKGSLQVGKKADLIILDANPLAVNKMHIKNISVLRCIKDGQIIFSK